MGSGGGFFPSGRSKEQINDELKKSLDRTKKEEFESKVAEIINNLLKNYNDRDTNKIQNRLEEIRNIIEKDIEGTFDFKYGGSVSKHTYVDGLSDIDSLIILNKTELMDKSPEKVRDFLLSKLKKNLSSIKNISKGTLAVTVAFKDGMTIQLLPAVKVKDGFKIPSYDGKEWSKINPKGFTDQLYKTNQKQGGKAVPAIKIIKSINAQFKQDRRMTGYHVESLAIEVFKSYNGQQTTKALITCFFDKAKELVLSSIRDKTGQSLHVDDYLGAKNSESRKAISYQLDVISKKIKSADNIGSEKQWEEILGEV